MRLTALAAAALLACASLAASSPPLTPIPEPIGAVVQLIDKAGNGFCSGFHIGDGLIVSAGHCADAKPVSVRLQDGSHRVVTVAAFADPKQGMEDFLILRISTSHGGVLADTLDCSHHLKTGTEVRTTGYPGILGLITVWGRIANDKATALPDAGWKHPVIRADVPIRGGASGSPLYDEATGKVIGIVVGADPANRSLALVTPIGVVCRMVSV